MTDYRNLEDFQYMSVKVRDWKVTSLGNAGVGALVAVGGWHFRFWSPGTGYKFNSVFVAGGVGIGAALEGKLGDAIGYGDKLHGAATSSYKDLYMERAVSISDFALANGTIFSASAGVAATVGAMHFRLYKGTEPLCSTMEGKGEVKVGAGVASNASAGMLILLGTQFNEYNLRRRFKAELERKPTDMFGPQFGPKF